MSWQPFRYDTYQSVRRNLFYYSIVVLNLAGFFAFERILPESHSQAVKDALASLSDDVLLKWVSGLVIFTGLAFVLTELLKVHDRIYDKYIVRWRKRYDTDFILPRLLKPFLHRVGGRFLTVAEENLGDFMERLYYPYVGDRDTKISKNKLVRFYEAVTMYWLTQINEIVLIMLACLIGVYRLFGPNDLSVDFSRQLLDSLLIVCVVVVLNRAWASWSRRNVRHATEDEITEIHEKHEGDLVGESPKSAKIIRSHTSQKLEHSV